ncbi:MAG: GtrA family protein [Pseudomonadota bacterium]
MMKIISEIINLLRRHHVSKQAIRFLLVGGGSTIISYSTFLVFLRIFDLHYLIANIGGFICSIGFSYYCNQRWTFDSKGSQRFTKYISFYLGSLVLGSILLRIIVEFFGVIPEIANLLAIAITTCVNFLGIKFLVFKK